MKKITIIPIALAGALAWISCQNIEAEFTPVHQDTPSTWTLTVNAERNDGPVTKGLAVEGEEATTTLLQSVWKSNEQVKVFLGSSCIGTLTATPDGTDAHKATLSGTVTTTNLTANVTRLTLLTPRESWDYTGQVGKLLISDDAVQSIEKNYHYTMASDVLVTKIFGVSITTENAIFTNQQSIYRMSFKYSGSGIAAKSVTISGASNKLVQSQAVDGSALVEGPISATLGTATDAPFFVALRNGDETKEEVLSFTVVDGDGVTYYGTKTIPSQYKPNGTFVSVKNTALTERLVFALSSTEVNTVL